MTKCIEPRMVFASPGGKREAVAEFNGGTISSDGGALLLHAADQKLNLLSRFSQCFLDGRDQTRVEHSVEQLIRQRVHGLALGYEDLNDHDQLRRDPLLGMMAGKAEPGTDWMAGKSTLNRLECGDGIMSRYRKITYWRDAIDELLVQVFVEAHAEAPAQITLDIDTTDLALHGQQEGRFFHGYYGHYCYLPLFVFCGHHVLCARLRPSSVGPAVGSRKEVERVVRQIRQYWPTVQIVLRGDSGFCTDELLHWCEQNGVDYVIGVARNARLQTMVAGALAEAQQEFATTQQPARVFVEFEHETVSGSWSQQRRVVAKAEHIAGKSNPRFVVTSLDTEARALYEQIYCARGDMENRIKEQFTLFADRVSASTMRANQLRLYLSVVGYTLLHGLRRLGLQSTEWATAQAGTIRLQLLKIGAVVQVTVRKVWIELASSFPWQAEFLQVFRQLHQ
jgi:hypothetical protein